MKIKLILIAFFLCSCTHNKFSGYVYDFDTGKPIRNVKVNVNGTITSTDSIGHFELEVNSNSRCVINFKRLGYANKKVLRKPDNLEKSKNNESKNSTIYMFKSESDFSK